MVERSLRPCFWARTLGTAPSVQQSWAGYRNDGIVFLCVNHWGTKPLALKSELLLLQKKKKESSSARVPLHLVSPEVAGWDRLPEDWKPSRWRMGPPEARSAFMRKPSLQGICEPTAKVNRHWCRFLSSEPGFVLESKAVLSTGERRQNGAVSG